MPIYQFRFNERVVPDEALSTLKAAGPLQQVRGRYVLLDTEEEKVAEILSAEPRWVASVLREPVLPEKGMRQALKAGLKTLQK